MQDFSLVTTLMRVPAGSVTGITDLDIWVTDDGTHVLATSRSGMTVSSFELASGGGASFTDDAFLPADISRTGVVRIGSDEFLAGIGPGLADPVIWSLGPDGAIGPVATLPAGTSASSGFGDFAVIETGGTLYFFGVGYRDGALYRYRVDAPDAMTALAGPPIDGGVSRVATATVGSTPILLTVSADGRTVRSHVIEPDGDLLAGDAIGADDGLGVAGIGTVLHVTLADADYLVIAARDSSSLSIVVIDSSGLMTATDHVFDDLETRFHNVTALTSATLGDRVFLAAGGGDDGATLFELLPGGRLLRTQTLLDTEDVALDAVGALALIPDGDSLQLLTGSATESGISQFHAPIGPVAPTLIGSGADDLMTGDARSQVLSGAAGNDTIDGGAGDDVLLDGRGADRLTGGTGRDVFVLTNDSGDDTITDFNPAEDLLDLSGLPFLRNPGQITFTATATGAELAFNGRTTVLQSWDRQPFTAAEVLTRYLLNLSRIVVGASGDTLTTGTHGADQLAGGIGGDRIEGRGGDDTLSGAGGDDLLIGGAGADRIDGGAGADTAGYSDAGWGVLADLEFPGANAGDAEGDIYVSIEHLDGSDFDDDLRGTAGANSIAAGSGSDILFGRGGADTLVGDAGEDTLIGGAEADILRGGTGIDRAAYWTAPGPLRADLVDPALNTGEAAGDTFDGIEDLQGTDFADDLRGDGAANRLWGGGGDDVLHGRFGDDVLDGGAGDDILLGGGGADTMIGGAGRDRAAYWTSQAPVLADLLFPDIGLGDAAGDTFADVEDLQGTGRADDIRGDDTGNRLWGVGGDDILYGRGGADSMFGQSGDDILLGGPCGDLLDGGSGTDRAAYYLASAAVTVDLVFAAVNSGEAAGDVFAGIEDLQGSSFDDDLRGTDGGNRIWGGDGDDVIHGRGGPDGLFGQGGDDILLSGAGGDVLDGGAGRDRAAYWTSPTGAMASLADPELNTGDAAGDSYMSIEDLQGTDFDDTLNGDSAANQLFGGDGSDILSGAGGDDTYWGGDGADQFLFTSGQDTVSDFAVGSDILRFDAALGLGPADLLALVQPFDGGALFDFGADGLFLSEIDPGQITTDQIDLF
ncbi:hypothetical protein HKCCE3408_12300 [Rhodobacterales bacterium HKCCE3408]|nr:hypothetical protein [Rhodobacterales bacterium HKCCE3408]